MISLESGVSPPRIDTSDADHPCLNDSDISTPPQGFPSPSLIRTGDHDKNARSPPYGFRAVALFVDAPSLFRPDGRKLRVEVYKRMWYTRCLFHKAGLDPEDADAARPLLPLTSPFWHTRYVSWCPLPSCCIFYERDSLTYTTTRGFCRTREATQLEK